jgi:hypothetical protein
LGVIAITCQGLYVVLGLISCCEELIFIELVKVCAMEVKVAKKIIKSVMRYGLKLIAFINIYFG